MADSQATHRRVTETVFATLRMEVEVDPSGYPETAWRLAEMEAQRFVEEITSVANLNKASRVVTGAKVVELTIREVDALNAPIRGGLMSDTQRVPVSIAGSERALRNRVDAHQIAMADAERQAMSPTHAADALEVLVESDLADSGAITETEADALRVAIVALRRVSVYGSQELDHRVKHQFRRAFVAGQAGELESFLEWWGAYGAEVTNVLQGTAANAAPTPQWIPMCKHCGHGELAHDAMPPEDGHKFERSTGDLSSQGQRPSDAQRRVIDRDPQLRAAYKHGRADALGALREALSPPLVLASDDATEIAAWFTERVRRAHDALQLDQSPAASEAGSEQTFGYYGPDQDEMRIALRADAAKIESLMDSDSSSASQDRSI